MKQTGLSVLLVLVVIATGVSLAQEKVTGSADKAYAKFDPSRDAIKDVKEAVDIATRSGRRILLDVGGEWCIWCRRLDSMIVRHADLAECMHENFVVVKVNYSKENKNEALLRTYPKVSGYPHFFILESDGTFLHSQETGVLEEGKGHSPGKVMVFLKKMGSEELTVRGC
jgi:thioredoxin-related protein